MDLGALLPLLAALVSATFAGVVWRSFATGGRRAHQLLWGLGLSAYALASGVDAYVTWRGWTPVLYVVYLATASGNVGLMGAGTMLLLRARMRRVGEAFAVAAALGIVILVVSASLATLDLAVLAREGPAAGLTPVARDGAGAIARLTFILESAIGGLALIGGALWSSWESRRVGVLLIGVGALVIAMGGTVEGVVARYAAHAGSAALAARLATQLFGIALMFVGYLRGRDAARIQRLRSDDILAEA